MLSEIKCGTIIIKSVIKQNLLMTSLESEIIKNINIYIYLRDVLIMNNLGVTGKKTFG